MIYRYPPRFVISNEQGEKLLALVHSGRFISTYGIRGIEQLVRAHRSFLPLESGFYDA